MKKPRGDSRLKTLPPDQQAQIYEWLRSPGGTREAVRDRIEREFGIKTNVASVSDFRAWYGLMKTIESADSLAEQLTKKLAATPGLKLSDDQIAKTAQVMFEMKAIEEGDHDLFMDLRVTRQNDTRLELDAKRVELMERRIQLLERKAAQADEAEKVAKSELTPEEKAAKIKEIFGVS